MHTNAVDACSSNNLGRFCGRTAALALLAILLSPIAAFAGHITLAWDPSPEAFVDGYVVYYGTTSGIYPSSVDVGNTTTYTINGLTNGVTVYFVVRAYSNDGTPSNPSNQVSGIAANLPPSITNPGSFTMRQGALTLSIVATDPDFDTLTYSALGLPSGLAINSATGVISGTVPVGVHTITARASDGATMVSSVFVITATVNIAPTLVAPGDQNNDTNDVVSLQLVAADLDLDPLTFSSTGLPAGLTLNTSTGRITGTPATGTGGANPVTVTVSDGSLSASRSFTWNVTDLNPGLVAAYGFEEASGTNATDASGNNQTGTISGATRTPSGRFGKALGFDGVNDWVTIAHSALLSLTNGMTLEAWVYPTANGAGAWRQVLIKEGVNVPYSLYSNDSANVPTSEVYSAAQPSTLKRAAGASQLPVNTWTHLAVTYDGTTSRLYVNGTLVGSIAVGGALLTSTSPMHIGGNSLWGEYFEGVIDEVRIFSVARSAAQITTDMNSPIVSIGLPPVLTNPGNQTNAENNVVSLALTATDPESDPITYSATGLPSSLTLNASTGVISGTLSYSSAGSHTVVVTATATGGSDSETFTWTVTNTNRAPVVTSPGDQTGNTGTAVSLAITATDADATALTFSATGLPTGLSINVSSGVITGTPTAAGVFATSITVSDGTTTASASFSWTISLFVPGAATLVAPTGTIPSQAPGFSWNAVSGATQYQLWVNDASQVGKIDATYAAAAVGCSAGTGTCTMSPGVTLAPGAALWWIRTANSAGDGTWSSGLAFTVPAPPDTTAPAVALTSPTSAATYTATSGTLAVGGTASDNVGVTQVSWTTNRGGSGVATGTTAWTIAAVPILSGTTIITVTARDAANNTATDTLTVSYDATAPTVTLTSPTSGTTYTATGGTLAVGGTASDNVGVTQVSWTTNRGGSGVATGTTAWTIAAVPILSGTTVITVTARDAANNTVTDALTVSYDTTAPTVTLTSPTSGATYTATGGTLAVGGTASDNVGVTQVSWTTDRGGSGVATGTTAWTIAAVPIASGTTVITVTARDATNNTATDTLTVTYSAAAPPGAATLLTPAQGATTGSATPSFSWTAVSGATHYQLWVNDASQPAKVDVTYTAAAAGCGAGTGTCTVSPGVTMASGSAMWWILTSNTAGPGPWSTGFSFTVPGAADTTAPTVALTSPTSGTTYTATGGTLAVGGTASDNVGVTQVSWTTNRGGSGVATGTTAWTIAAVPILSGTTIITVTARDAANNTATDTLTVSYDATAPTVTVTSPTSGTTYTATGGTLAVGGTASDNVGVTQVSWTTNRGGSGVATGTTAWTIAAVPILSGTTVITVTARDATNNTATDTLTVTYSAGAAPGAATLLTPAQGATTGSATPGFSWTAVSGATHYQLWVNDASQQAKIDLTYTGAAAGCGAGTGTCTVNPGVTLAPGAATWWILTSNTGSPGTWSTGFSFTVPVGTVTPPGAATLIGPNGASATPTPSFSWAAVSGATHYQLWVNDSSTMARINVTYTAAAAGCASGTGTCTVSPGVTLAPGQALWWILTSNGAGNGPWSAGFAFMVP